PYTTLFRSCAEHTGYVPADRLSAVVQADRVRIGVPVERDGFEPGAVLRADHVGDALLGGVERLGGVARAVPCPVLLGGGEESAGHERADHHEGEDGGREGKALLGAIR